MRSNSLTTIAICSDTHFWSGSENRRVNGGRVQLQQSSQKLQDSLLGAFQSAQPDLVIHLGDWTCGGGFYAMPEEDFIATLRQSHQAFTHLNTPVHALPGNHDCPPGGGDYSFFSHLWGAEPGIGYLADYPTARIVTLNTHGHTCQQLAEAAPGDPVYGWVSDAELARLDYALATSGGRPVILFMHQLLRPWIADYPWHEIYEVRNRQAVIDVMARYGNVRAVFQGHAHMLDVHQEEIGGATCNFIVTPAVIEYPLGWLLLQLSSGVLSVQMQKLPLRELAELSRDSGEGQQWRDGRHEWQSFCIDLA